MSALGGKADMAGTMWVSIAAIALCTYFWHSVLYVLAVMFIGARQHALNIMGHDSSQMGV